MEAAYTCEVCHQWVAPTGSACLCNPKREFPAQPLFLYRHADIELSGNGAGLNTRRPIPDTQGKD